MTARLTRRRTVTLFSLAIVVAATAALAGSSGQAIAQGHVAGGSRQLFVKLHDADRIRVRSAALQSIPTSGATAAAQVSDRRAHLLQLLVDGTKGVRVRRMFSRTEQDLDDEHRRITSEGHDVANLNSFVAMDVPIDQDIDAFASALRRLPGVDEVGILPTPSPLPSPDYTPYLTYRFSDGVDAPLPAIVPGSTGSNVTIADIEYSWNQNHEDVGAASGAEVILRNGTPVDPFANTNHGTAVLGVLAGTADQQGVTGLAPQATIRLVNANTSEGYNLGNAISLAHSALKAGDVILIEQQTPGPIGCDSSQFGCVPVEWFLPAYDAVKSATADGIIVVEAAGNGSQNLDDTVRYGTPFPSGRSDSGAIIVGASSNCFVSGERMNYSDYGSRVDVSAPGECVVTAGYGDLYSGGANALYTGSFGGTSSASSIVAGVAALVSSVAKQQGITLSSVGMRQLLKESGLPIQPGSSIGPLAKTRAALYRFVPTARLAAPSTVKVRRTITLDASATVDPQGSPLTFNWDLDGDGVFADATGPVTSTRAPSSPGTLSISVRVSDPSGASDDATSIVTIIPDVRTIAPSAPVNATIPDRGPAPGAEVPSTTPRRGAPAAG